MFDIGFSEVLLIFVIALIVLGPEKLPRAASQVGRWIGRARAMARQFKDQLEEEVNLENVRKAHKEAAAKEEAAAKDVGSGDATPGAAGAVVASTAAGAEGSAATGATGTAEAGSAGASPGGYTPSLDPTDFRADTFSHAHPTDEYGANPQTPNGAPPDTSTTPTPAASHGELTGSSAASSSPADSAPFPRDPQSVSRESAGDPQTAPAEAGHHPANAAASPKPATFQPPANDPVHEPAAVPSVQSDNHGQL